MKDMQKFKNVTQPPSLGRRAELHFLMGSRAAVPVGSWRQNENQRYLGKRSSKCRAWWGQFESLSQALIYQLSITFFLYIAHPYFVWAKIRAETSCETGSPSFPWKWGEINSYMMPSKERWRIERKVAQRITCTDLWPKVAIHTSLDISLKLWFITMMQVMKIGLQVYTSTKDIETAQRLTICVCHKQNFVPNV